MDAGSKKEDFLLLEDEKFDFDLSLSSSSTNEDDEVFFGPVGHKERCIAASLDLNRRVPGQPLAPGSGSPCTLSPLTGEKFVEVYKEAHLLALQIESHSRREVAQAATPQNPVNQGKETFVQDSQLKVSLFEKEQKRDRSPMSLKRETFCLPSSRVQPPMGEPQLLASPGLLSSPVSAGPAQTQSNQGLPCSSHPTTQTVSIKRRDSYLSCKTEAVSTTTNPFKVPQFSVGESPGGVTPKFSRTHRLQSWTPASRVVSSTPVRRSSGTTPQGLPGSMRTPLSTRRMSVLPTPASRRLSSLPLMAPQSMPRALVSPLCVPARRLSSEPRRRSTVRAELTQESSGSGSGGQAQGLSSDESSSPPSSVPQALNFSPEKSASPPPQENVDSPLLKF